MCVPCACACACVCVCACVRARGDGSLSRNPVFTTEVDMFGDKVAPTARLSISLSLTLSISLYLSLSLSLSREHTQTYVSARARAHTRTHTVEAQHNAQGLAVLGMLTRTQVSRKVCVHLCMCVDVCV
jgi:hypothetical protein